MQLNDDFKEFIELLNGNEVRYLVVLGIDKLLVNFISLDDLIRNKRATARPQDLADVDHLET